jgi:hypothetical protein
MSALYARRIAFASLGSGVVKMMSFAYGRGVGDRNNGRYATASAAGIGYTASPTVRG